MAVIIVSNSMKKLVATDLHVMQIHFATCTCSYKAQNTFIW